MSVRNRGAVPTTMTGHAGLYRPVLLVLALGLLGACSTKEQTRVTQAVSTPLSDLNLVKVEIPPILLESLKAPYAMPGPDACPAIREEVARLDEALGPDLDQPVSPSNPSLLERGVDEAKDAVVKSIGRTTEGVLPFRSWVRRLTGAEKYHRKVMAAVTAGTVRRAFLKGVGAARACPSI